MLLYHYVPPEHALKAMGGCFFERLAIPEPSLGWWQKAISSALAEPEASERFANSAAVRRFDKHPRFWGATSVFEAQWWTSSEMWNPHGIAARGIAIGVDFRQLSNLAHDRDAALVCCSAQTFRPAPMPATAGCGPLQIARRLGGYAAGLARAAERPGCAYLWTSVITRTHKDPTVKLCSDPVAGVVCCIRQDLPLGAVTEVVCGPRVDDIAYHAVRTALRRAGRTSVVLRRATSSTPCLDPGAMH